MTTTTATTPTTALANLTVTINGNFFCLQFENSEIWTHSLDALRLCLWFMGARKAPVDEEELYKAQDDGKPWTTEFTQTRESFNTLRAFFSLDTETTDAVRKYFSEFLKALPVEATKLGRTVEVTRFGPDGYEVSSGSRDCFITFSSPWRLNPRLIRIQFRDMFKFMYARPFKVGQVWKLMNPDGRAETEELTPAGLARKVAELVG